MSRITVALCVFGVATIVGGAVSFQDFGNLRDVAALLHILIGTVAVSAGAIVHAIGKKT